MLQISKLLSLRISQSVRFIKETGIFIILLALFLMTGGILSTVENLLGFHQLYSLAAIVLIILTIDRIRHDKNFLNQVLGGKTQVAFYLSVEYLLIFTPFILFKLIIGQYLISLGIIVITILFSFITPYLTKVNSQSYKRSFKIIPLEYFELKFFVEKHKISFVSVIVLLFLGIIHFSLWVLGIFILMSLIIEVFSAQEPMEMIDWNPRFVSHKIFKYYNVALPILILCSVITYLRSDISIFVFIYGICVILTSIALAISNKYSEYYGLTDNVKSKLPVTINVFLMLLPGFIIVTIGYTILKYRKAESQMKHICSR